MEDRNSRVEFEETELRLGLPGGGGGGEEQEENSKETTDANGKRSYEQISTLDLKLKLAPNDTTNAMGYLIQKQKYLLLNPTQRVDKLPPAKAQMVGWPPVRSFRYKIIAGDQRSSLDQANDKFSERSGAAALVKVSMHGAPYLRKVDLNTYKNYRELCDALANMFHSFTAGGCESQGMIRFMKESNLVDILNSSKYVPTYEDKDGDWLLVGDVPWEMFVVSCKRLRIMKETEAIGLAPRALEKFKNL